MAGEDLVMAQVEKDMVLSADGTGAAQKRYAILVVHKLDTYIGVSIW